MLPCSYEVFSVFIPRPAGHHALELKLASQLSSTARPSKDTSHGSRRNINCRPFVFCHGQVLELTEPVEDRMGYVYERKAILQQLRNARGGPIACPVAGEAGPGWGDAQA